MDTAGGDGHADVRVCPCKPVPVRRANFEFPVPTIHGALLVQPIVRRATPDDIPALVDLVYDLAEYEKARNECTLTAEQLRAALFEPSPAVFAHVATLDGVVAGCAIWFLNFSTWDGVHGIHLEDLYVRPEARGAGIGKALVAALARVAVDRGYTRVGWSVLTWNTPAVEFYEALGAVVQDEWVGYRLGGDALTALAAGASRSRAQGRVDRSPSAAAPYSDANHREVAGRKSSTSAPTTTSPSTEP